MTPSADKGVYVVALTTTKAGQPLAQELPLITGSIAEDRCALCSKKLVALAPGGIVMGAPCKKACGEVYCSVACRKQAAATHHTWQCSKEIQGELHKMRRGVAASGFTMSSRVPLCIARALGMVSRQANLLSEVRPLQHLSLGKFDEGEVSVQHGLQQYTSILQALQLDPAWFDYYTYDYARFAIINNAFALKGSNASSSSSSSSPSIGFGMAVYGASTYFNHSCVPDVDWSIGEVDEHGAFMQLTALRDIAPRESLHISYIDHTQPLARRTEALMQYGFTCQCALCQQQRSKT
jgi:hypothetical protein